MCVICRKGYDDNTTEIDCNKCQNVTELPFLPNLQRLYCYNTNITVLPEYPKLQDLWCRNTKISFIPKYPNLQELFCANTKVTVIPEYPNLQKLDCYNTQITVLPEYPNLQYLSCKNTNITVLPEYPNLQYKIIDNCIWLKESYRNKKDFQKRINKLIIIQRLWKWKKINHLIPLIKDIKEYCIKVYYL